MSEVNGLYDYYFGLLPMSYKEVLERMQRLGEIESPNRIPEHIQLSHSMTFGFSNSLATT